MTLLPSDQLTLHLFGSFEALRGGTALSGLHLRDGERLLAFLALRCGEPVATREVAERFYPAEARGNLVGQNDFPSLRQALFALRQALGPDAERLTRPARTTVHLDLAGADADFLTFDRLSDMEEWEAAAALYQAPLLEGWNEAWVVEARKRRHRAFERMLRRLAQGEGGKAEHWLRRLNALCPTDEAVACDLMRLLSARGQYAEMEEIREALQERVKAAGRAPEAETLALLSMLRGERQRAQSLAIPVPSVALPTEPEKPFALPTEPEKPFALPTEPEKPFAPSSASCEPPSERRLEPAGGAVPVGSPYYIARPADAEFGQAVARRDSIVLVKGARQVGKTSLLAHGLQQARQAGARVAVSDFQNFNDAQFATPDTLLMALATTLAIQLDLETLPREVWDADCGANMNLGLYLRRHALRSVEGHLVWALDEVDRLFGCPFGSEVFGLFRSWHNARALDPHGPWSRLTLAIAYSTEASLFITDLNQSPFNVGTRLGLHDFTLAQTAELNGRCGSPLNPTELARFYDLVGGQPYLTRRGLNELILRPDSAAQLEAESARDDGVFGEHLRRLLSVLSRSPDMTDVVRALLQGRPCASPEAFFRLRASGVLSGASCAEARLRCRLYAEYLSAHL